LLSIEAHLGPQQVLSAELGSDWQNLFSTFERTPIASASIGQVHRATLSANGKEVAVKIQFPGISQSINSDLNNISLLLKTTALLPKGLYLQNTIATMRRELEDECDYVREGDAGRRFTEYLKGDDYFVVPRVVDEATSEKVLTTEWMSGRPLSKAKNLSQEARDKVCLVLTVSLQAKSHLLDWQEHTPPMPDRALPTPLHAD
jgi:aarF domain-containing kinase